MFFVQEENKKMLAKLEGDFEKVLASISGLRGVDKLRLEYQKISNALKASFNSERQLNHKLAALQAELDRKLVDVENVRTMSETDQQVVETHRREMENVLKMLDSVNNREKEVRANCVHLKRELTEMEKLVEEGANKKGDESVEELIKIKDTLTAQRDQKTKEIEELRTQLDVFISSQGAADEMIKQGQTRISELEKELVARERNTQHLQRIIERLEKEKNVAKSESDQNNSEIKQLKSVLDKLRLDNSKLDDMYTNLKTSTDSLSKEKASLAKQNNKLQFDYTLLKSRYEECREENTQKRDMITQKDADNSTLKSQVSDLTTLRDSLYRKNRVAEDNLTVNLQEKEDLKTQIALLDKTVQSLNKGLGQAKQKAATIQKDFELQSHALKTETHNLEIANESIEMKKITINQLEHHVSESEHMITKNNQAISDLQIQLIKVRERETKLNKKIVLLTEYLDIAERQVADGTKAIAKADKDHKEFQKRYDMARNERNACGKELLETNDKLSDEKKKAEITEFQVNQLREELAHKDAIVLTEKLQHEQLIKNVQHVQEAQHKMERASHELQLTIKRKDAEEKRVLRQQATLHVELERCRLENASLTKERDIIGTQLLRRNDELGLLVEKLTIQANVLKKGEVQYNQRLDDIQLLKMELERCRRRNAMLMRQQSTLVDMRHELYHEQQNSLLTRTRCKLLEEELENPMNVHRWRKLKGSDPSIYEMIIKIQLIQRRLVVKSEEVVGLLSQLQERDQKYLALERVMARMPGTETAEQLLLCRQNVKKRTRQLKALKAELNMHETKEKEMKKEMKCMAPKLLAFKKRDLAEKNKKRQLSQSNIAAH